MNRLIIEYQKFYNDTTANKDNIIQKLNDCSIAGLTSFIIYLKNKLYCCPIGINGEKVGKI